MLPGNGVSEAVPVNCGTVSALSFKADGSYEDEQRGGDGNHEDEQRGADGSKEMSKRR